MASSSASSVARNRRFVRSTTIASIDLNVRFLQDVRVEVSQIEDGGGFTRTLRKKKGKSSEWKSNVCMQFYPLLCVSTEKKDGAECTDSDSHALETFQRIMKRQCDALIALGFNSSVKVRGGVNWMYYHQYMQALTQYEKV